MKKALILALLTGLAVLASCQKEANTIPTKSSLKTLSYQMWSGSMYTKSATAEDVLSIINSSLPEHVSVVLKGQTNGRTISVTTGEAQNIPSDTYSVVGSFLGNQIGQAVSGAGDAIQDAPSFSMVKTPLTITDEETNYSLPAKFNCFALACDMTLVQSITFTDAYSNENTVTPVTLNDTGVFFAYGDFTQNYLHLTITPKDTELYRVTEYTITTGAIANLEHAEKGKWYLVSPALVGAQPKLIQYDLPTMEQGTF